MEKKPRIEKRNTQFTFIERTAPEILDALATAPLYKKYGHVKARPAAPGERITTIFEDGTLETTNKAKKGDWVITNPSGERYILSKKNFLDRYMMTAKDGVYRAQGYCRAIQNPFKKPIKILASWGSSQTGDERCLIADTCDARGTCDGEPYLIDADAFSRTYKRVRAHNAKKKDAKKP